MSEPEDDVSRFTVDGVVAEMVIEVEDHQKPPNDDLTNPPTKSSTKDKKADDHDDSAKGVEKDDEESELEKKEDKENIEASEITKYDREGSNDLSEEDEIVNETLKRKRKNKLIENQDKVSNMPRYSGVKKRKLETDFKDEKKEMKDISNNKDPNKSPQNAKESVVNEETNDDCEVESGSNSSNIKDILKKCIKDIDEIELENSGGAAVEKDELKDKKNVLRKLPFRKNQDAPDIPDLKPKIFWWDGVGEGEGVKLGDIPEIKERIKGAKGLKSLFRVLFFQWPTNGQNLIAKILQFNGFPFDKSSYEFTKRQNLMKIMLDGTLSNMCELLDLKKGSKQTMINNILNFLMRPYKKVDPTLDPSLQPVVLLEKIELDDKFFDQISKDSKGNRGVIRTKSYVPLKKNKLKVVESLAITTRTTRNSIRRPGRPRKYPLGKNVSAGKLALKQNNRSLLKPISKEKVPVAKEVKTRTTNDSSKDDKHSLKEKKKTEEKLEDSDKGMKKIMKKTKEIDDKKVISKKSDDDVDDAIENMTVDNDFDTESPKKENKEKEPVKVTSAVSKVNLSDSSETESAEETKLVTAMKKPAKPLQRRKGKPLGHFPKISECIQKANFSALQRLHILLFGASDKADNLKANILAFGGFPFLEGSDEWKQKHFLLSLLAQNNLREYLNLLCIHYTDDDQPTMINKLMKFLAAPSVPSDMPSGIKIQPIETEVVSSELTNKSPARILPKGKPEVKKRAKKKEEKKVGPRNRKVLMSEEEARRLEASFAREQRALARDRKAPPPLVMGQNAVMPVPSTPLGKSRLEKTGPIVKIKPVADPHQLNALLQTVYKRRALKAAGAVVSTPNKGEKTKLGDIENVKFLIVTGSFADLEILHRLIFMLDASKSRIRKNILDFDGFGFNEDSKKYQERIDFLYSLGYDVSKRISFLLGLCPLQTTIPQQDLNELIMYFLMSPCKTKQVVPITEMPRVGTSGENFIMIKSTFNPYAHAQYQSVLQTGTPKKPRSSMMQYQTSTPIPKEPGQRARKSFHSTPKVSPVKKLILPPSQAPVIVSNEALGNKSPITLLNSVPGVPAYSFAKMPANMAVLNTPNNLALLNTGKVPLNLGTKMQIMNQQPPNVAVLDAAAKIPVSSVNVTGQVLQNPVVIPQQSNKIGIQPQKNILPQNILQGPILPGSVLMKNSSGFSSAAPQEFLIQQQTPDGQQKTFKLIRLPSNHPLASVVGKPSAQQTVVSPAVQKSTVSPQIQQSTVSPQVQQTIVTAPLQQQLILTNTPATGLVIMKNNPVKDLQSDLKNVPLKAVPSSSISTTGSDVSVTKPNEFILPDKGDSAETFDNSENSGAENTNSSQENPPTDKELFTSIQEIILSSNFEDITLRNVIERVSAQFPLHNLTQRHNYMKECVKKIIIGTS